MKRPREENRSSRDAGAAHSPAPGVLPQVAVGWLREILQSEFAAERDLAAQPRARSEDRELQREDWLRLLARINVLALTDPLTGLAGPGQLGVVLDHAWAVAEAGDPLTMVAVQLDRTGMAAETGAYERALREAARVLREETQNCGITLRHTAYEFLLVLPLMEVPEAEMLLARSHVQLAEHGQFHAGFAAYTPQIASADQLLEAAGRALAAACR